MRHQIRREGPALAAGRCGVVARERVQQHTGSRARAQIAGLNEQAADHAREHVAHARGRHPGVAAIADAGSVVAGRDERLRALEYRDRVVASCEGARGGEPIAESLFDGAA